VRSAAALAVFILLVVAAASFGAVFQPGDWYEDLRKPPLTPPNWIFGPVWSVLYLCVAVAAWLVWRASADRTALALWSAQLTLNALWSYLFFGLHQPALALVEILCLLGLIVATFAVFLRESSLAGSLIVPYAAWVGFASYLNAGVWYLNR
jgi:tryptophan-rich sensory protein